MFNAHIESWLYELNEIFPILLAARDKVEESVGVEFSDWDSWSLKQYISILPYFDDVIANYDYDSEKAIILINARNMMDDILKYDSKYASYFHAGKVEFEAFEKGNIEPLKNISNPNYAKETILVFNIWLSEKHHASIIKYADVFLDFTAKFQNKIPDVVLNRLMFKIWSSAYKESNNELMQQIPKSPTLGNHIADEGYLLILSKDFKKSIELFKYALEFDGLRVNAYCNALYVLLPDNHNIPLDLTLAKKFLRICLPYAEKNPKVYYNAACLYVEMNRYNEACKMIKKAIKHNCNVEHMFMELQILEMFKDFTAKTNVLRFFGSMKPI